MRERRNRNRKKYYCGGGGFVTCIGSKTPFYQGTTIIMLSVSTPPLPRLSLSLSKAPSRGAHRTVFRTGSYMGFAAVLSVTSLIHQQSTLQIVLRPNLPKT